MNIALLTVQIRYERDIVLSRQRARQLANELGFDRQDEIRIATIVSELSRNVFQYAKRGKVEFSCENTTGNLQIVVSDQGSGIANLKDILEGQYVSKTGMGLGLTGARRLMDHFNIESSNRGTTVTVGKNQTLPAPVTNKKLETILNAISGQHSEDPFQEIQRQNQDLLAAMDTLQKNQLELNQLNRELEDTNRGVVALYAELDEKADYLRRASEIKIPLFIQYDP